MPFFVACACMKFLKLQQAQRERCGHGLHGMNGMISNPFPQALCIAALEDSHLLTIDV